MDEVGVGLGAPWLLEAAAGVPGAPQALELVSAAAVPAVAHHSARTLRYALAIAHREGAPVDRGALFHACALHDVGAVGPRSGPERSEVAGADAAVELLEAHGYSPRQCEQVWAAIAVHTSPHVAERMSPLTRLVRLGVRADFGADLVTPDLRAATERDCPRLDVERVLSAAVVAQCLADPARAPSGSWPAALLAAHRASTDPRMAAF